MERIKTLSLDLETYSSIDLAKCGVYKYAESPDFEILLFACTAGSEIDRRINREKLVSPVRGLLMSAIGSQQVEGACDRLCNLLAAEHPEKQLVTRYSPGYGDLPLEIQKDVFRALDCERSIGVTLTESLLMQPSKSVTAVIGMKERDAE